nr:PREDICTED: pleckstrin homology domain-containing family B member 2 isoform X4 [Equus przewalskii]
MMTKLGRVSRIRSTCQWTASISAWDMNVGMCSLQMGSRKTVCCRLFAEMGKRSVFVQKAQMIVWPGNLRFRIPGQIQLMWAQKSCMMRLLWLLLHLPTQPMPHQPLRHMAMVHTAVCTRPELRWSTLRMGRLMLYPTSTHVQDFMDNSLPTKSSFVSGIETMTLIWRWACWLEQLRAWP